MLPARLNAINGERLYTRSALILCDWNQWRQVNKTIYEGDTLQSYPHQIDVKKEGLGNLGDI